MRSKLSGVVLQANLQSKVVPAQESLQLPYCIVAPGIRTIQKVANKQASSSTYRKQ